MNRRTTPEDPVRMVVRLVALRPGASQEELVRALQRLYRRKSPDELRRALARIPLTLTRSATEEQAQKIRRFLEARGAVLEIAYVTPPEPERAEPTPVQPLSSGWTGPPHGVERRTKPRIHPGILLRPMGVGEILDRSFRLLKDHFGVYFLILLIPHAIAFLVGKVLQLLLQGAAGGITLVSGLGVAASIFLVVAVFLILQIWAQGALIHAVSETYLGHRTSVGEAYGAMRPRLSRLLGTLFLMWFLVGLGTLLFIIPGILLFMNWLMADKVVVLEGGKGMQALRRSKELMKYRAEPGFWKGPRMKAGIILLVGLLIGIGIRILFQIPGAVLNLLIPDNFFIMTLNDALQVMAEALATTYVAIAMILYYYDIRIRREGFDLKMMAQGL